MSSTPIGAGLERSARVEGTLRFPPARMALESAALAAVYFVAGSAGLQLAVVQETVTLVWAPSGIAVAAVLLLGIRALPGIAVGAIAVSASTGAPPGFALATGIGNPLEALIAGFLLHRFGRVGGRLDTVPRVLALVSFGACLATTVSASIGVTSMCLTGMTPWSEFARVWSFWWIGDAMGILIVTPALLSLSHDAEAPWSRRRWLEAAAATATLGLVCSAVFGDALGSPHQHLPLTFLPFAVVVVMALRLEDRGAAVGLLVTALTAVLATVHGRGPFGEMDAQAGIWLLWPFMGFLAVAALLLGASSAERRQSRSRLERAYSRVDALVEERTAALRETQARLEAANRHLRKLATHDGLTGIPNRRSFDEQLAREFRRATRNGSWLSVVLADVDSFKAYNDSRGHQAGDRCLRALARALSRVVRRGGDRVSRYGGEEFAILLPETPPTGAEKVAEQLRATVEDLGLEHGAAQSGDRVTISLGVASLRPGPATPPEQLVEHADDQLYLAKNEGRNQVRSVVVRTEHSDGPAR